MNRKGSVLVVALIAVVLAIIAGGAWYYYSMQRLSVPISQTASATKSTDQTSASSGETYRMPLCGVTVVDKNNETSSLSSDGMSLRFGGNNFGVDCWPSSTWLSDGFDIQTVLGIDGDHPGVLVNKNDYQVFDRATLASIQTLYSEYPAPHNPTMEFVGFSNQNWYYRFSFVDPSQDKNQNDYIISVISSASTTP